MAVLQLRRDRVVVDEPVVEIDTPFPLRTIDVQATEADDIDHEPPRRTFMGVVRGWFYGLVTLALILAYPTLIVLGSDVGDRKPIAVDRAQWTAPWAGGASLLMERHFTDLGWAADAPSWAPMARLTAKPAYQSALAETLGEYISLMNRQAVAHGSQDQDLSAATRLVTVSSTGAQMRAGRDALISYDRRLRRRAATPPAEPVHVAAQLGLIESWATRSQSELALTADVLDGSPLDETATTAVYKAKARAMTAMTLIDTMNWSDDPKVTDARNASVAAWKAAAQFHPLVVLNGSPDGSLFGNHPTSMGFLLSKAQKATADFRAALGTAAPDQIAEAPAAAAAPPPPAN